MVGIMERIPRLLQAIFGEVADTAARTTGFIQRERGFSGSEFVRALVFGWWACPRASIEVLADGLGISGSALQQRLTKSASETLWTVLKAAVELLAASRVVTIPLLSKFNGVYAEDCSNIGLPAEMADQFPGCGCHDGQSGKAALRLFVCYELKTGTLQNLAVAQARGIDAVVAQQHAPALPAGALRLRDMGFFDRQLLAQDTAAGVFWISRLPANLTVQPEEGSSLPVSKFLEQQPDHVDRLDCELSVGQHGTKSPPLKCRFIAVRCPPEVAARRRQKVHETARRKGKTASQRQLILCDWTVLITNVPESKLSIREAWELYCSRWQIELLFKRWKSLGGVQISKKWKAERVLCELYAKLLGMLVAHWFTLIRGGPLAGFSLTKAIHKIQQFANCLAEVLAAGGSELLAQLVAQIGKVIERIPPQQKRTKHPSTRQRLFRPRLKA